MSAISQTTFSNAFSWMKSFVFWLKFYWSLFLRVQLIGSDNGLVPNRRQAIIWTNADPIHWRIYAALGGDELKATETVYIQVYIFILLSTVYFNLLTRSDTYMCQSTWTLFLKNKVCCLFKAKPLHEPKLDRWWDPWEPNSVRFKSMCDFHSRRWTWKCHL